MTLEIKLVGFNRVANGLRKFAHEVPKITDTVTGEHTRKLQRILKSEPYPAKRPNQTYVRTGRLANSFSARRQAIGQWQIRNSAAYAHYVVDKQNQAWMHKNRWWTVQEVEKRHRPELTRKLTDELVKAANNG